MSASTRVRRLLRRRVSVLALAASATVLASSAAAPAAQASGPAWWAAEKLAGGVVGGAGSAGFGSALSAIGLGDQSAAQFAAIRRDLGEIKQQISAVSEQIRGLSTQLAQTGCNTGTHQLGDVRALATDGWERYETLLNRADPAARTAGLPAVRAYLEPRDFRAARKRIHTALAAPGAGAQTLLQICGAAIEKPAYPFLTSDTSKRVRAFLDDWQLVQVRLSALEVEKLMLQGDADGAREEAASLKRDLAAEDGLMPKAMPADLFLDLRTNLVWSRKAEATTWNRLYETPSLWSVTPTMEQAEDLVKAPCCTVGDGPGARVTREAWLRRLAGVDFKTYFSTSPPMAGLWTRQPFFPRESVVIRLIGDSPFPAQPAYSKDFYSLRWNETHVLLRVRPLKPDERWSVGQGVCLPAGGAASAGAAPAAARLAAATVRRVGRTWIGTPTGDVIVAGKRAVVRSGRGPDVIAVGGGSRVFAGGCNDVIRVKGSGTVVHGGRDDDTVRVLGGRAVVHGDGGDDDLRGGRGDDRLRGGAGNDTLDAGAGDDLLVGGRGRDVLFGGAGDDRLDARDGVRDVVDCGPGDDIARVEGRDVVRGCERVLRR